MKLFSQSLKRSEPKVRLILSVILVFLSGCSIKGVNTTMFLKEDGSRIYNLKGEDCLESGYQAVKAPNGDTYRLITFYSNCDVHKERDMKDFEPQQWLIKPKRIQ